MNVGPWYKIDFCSKWAYGNNMETFGLSRDVFKTLTTKQFYTKRNAEILQNPYIHAKAIYEGFKT